jgi:hypothetical protein
MGGTGGIYLKPLILKNEPKKICAKNILTRRWFYPPVPPLRVKSYGRVSKQ